MASPMDQKHFRHLLLNAYNKGQKAAAAARDICNVYGEGSMPEATARYWYGKFKNGNFDLDDTPRSGRPSNFDEDQLRELLKKDGRQTQRELAEKMGCSQSTIFHHLKSMGFTQKLGAWVPHKLNEKQSPHPVISGGNSQNS